MGKTKLLTEVRKSLMRINSDTTSSGKPAFHLLFGVADIANKSQKLHPWRRIFNDLFHVDQNRWVGGWRWERWVQAVGDGRGWSRTADPFRTLD